MKNETLQLVLKYRWFCLIYHCVKKSEYRELNSYWRKRLLSKRVPRSFQFVRFRWGYQEGAPAMVLQCLGIVIDKTHKRFDIQLGALLKEENCEPIGIPTPEDLKAHREVKNGNKALDQL